MDPNGDDDGDGMPNGWEIRYGLDPRDPSDAALDSDAEGRVTSQRGATYPVDYAYDAGGKEVKSARYAEQNSAGLNE